MERATSRPNWQVPNCQWPIQFVFPRIVSPAIHIRCPLGLVRWDSQVPRYLKFQIHPDPTNLDKLPWQKLQTYEWHPVGQSSPAFFPELFLLKYESVIYRWCCVAILRFSGTWNFKFIQIQTFFTKLHYKTYNILVNKGRITSSNGRIWLNLKPQVSEDLCIKTHQRE